ncbi:hypothetical protein FOZ61_004429 [Perkinsus olseni]|uniref:subtilisin n=1 Tax=Perkinsus olseni TaxID=32597 RepID=A0A7J6M899_PEROL|nr:hypothetical protein FOZ61_004429 [Perkinsus olseni]KAF4667656.1 hypothetical protein FOL46_002402 [Perkinsus olseni]
MDLGEGTATNTLVRISLHGARLDIRRLPAMMASVGEASGSKLPFVTQDDREAEQCFLRDGMVFDLPVVKVKIIESKCSASYTQILNYLRKAEKMLDIRFDCEPDSKITLTTANHRVGTPPPCIGGNTRLGTNDPISSCQRNLERIRIREAWELVRSAKRNSKKAILAIFDGGVDATHPDLVNQFWRDPIDGSIGYNSLYDNRDVTDHDGHGTLVAGVAGAETNNGIGIAGVADVQLMILKWEHDGGGTSTSLLKALDFAVKMGAVASVHSYALPHHEIFRKAFADAAATGHVIVASAGNDGKHLDKTPQYPCSYAHRIPSMLCVAGSTSTKGPGTIASWSNVGTAVQIAAPGVNILYTLRPAMVGAVAAMLGSLGLEGQEITDAIIKSRTAGLSTKFNVPDVGELDALNAVKIALGLPTGTSATSTPSSENAR